MWPWDFGKAKDGFLNVNMSGTLRDAMMENPELKVFVGNGYFDLATPYFATEYTFNHMNLDPSLAGHVTMEYYETGHMPYTDLSSLKKMKEDLSRFIKASFKEKNS